MGTNKRQAQRREQQKGERDALLQWHYGTEVLTWPVLPPTLAVPPPFNNNIVLGGNCHIPTGQYSGGYARHVEVFQRYYGWKPQMVLHRCHRPYCDQPGHLSGGNAQLNADDRQMMAGKGGRITFAHPRIREFASQIEPIRVALDPSWGLPFGGVEFPEFCDEGQHVWGLADGVRATASASFAMLLLADRSAWSLPSYSSVCFSAA